MAKSVLEKPFEVNNKNAKAFLKYSVIQAF